MLLICSIIVIIVTCKVEKTDKEEKQRLTILLVMIVVVQANFSPYFICKHHLYSVILAFLGESSGLPTSKMVEFFTF